MENRGEKENPADHIILKKSAGRYISYKYNQ